jgi:tetratricopeptide (TPR) repeat protein
VSKPTLGLSMITNSFEQTEQIIKKYSKFFYAHYITVADKDKKVYDKLVEKYGLNDDFHFSYYKWNDNFGKARQFNQKQIKTDYWFWIDSDDVIEGAENIPEMLELMHLNNLDVMYLLYDYDKNELGESIAPHWRERMVKTDSLLKWSDSRCHETLLAPSAASYRYENTVIVHNKSPEDHQKSLERNIKLLQLDFDETKDPRSAMYLGDNHMAKKDFDKAIEYLLFLLQHGGWDEDKYRAWLKLSECYYQIGDLANSLQCCNAAEELKPAYPDSYFQKASVYNAMGMSEQTYEWIKVAMSKPVPQTLSVTDPTLYEYRGIFCGALSALELGKVDEAYQLYSVVKQRSPGYISKVYGDEASKLENLFVESKEDTEAIKRLKWLLYYCKDRGSDIGRLLNTLPIKIVADPRLNADRAKLLPQKKWPEKSIVFYCGPGTEPWGPEYLEHGCGGSEEAIIYLSRELAKLGWDVTVFNDREEEYIDFLSEKIDLPNTIGEKPSTVRYRPWTMLNPFDEFDVFVAWRHPQNALNVKARVLCVDMHDTPTGHVSPNPEHVKQIDKFFLKSNYQHKLSDTPIPEDKAVIVGNGIVKEQFDAN